MFLFWFTTVALVLIFAGRWIYAIDKGYFGSFVKHDASASQAVANMTGLTPSVKEQETLLPLQKEWDLYTSSRLRDEVTTTASDGAVLHGYLYDEGSDVTVVVIPRFDMDGTEDFLPGPWLSETTGCNILLTDPRAHGGSGGDYFGFGYLEQNDVKSWLSWADETLGEQTFVLWGEGSGANAALFADASGLLPDSVRGIVAESPFASLHQTAATDIWKWFQVPAVPFLNFIEWTVSRSDAGYTVSDVELAAALKDSSASVPVLFLTSTGDDYILADWTKQVYDAYPGEKQLVEGAGSHGTVYASEQSSIQSTLKSWLAD